MHTAKSHDMDELSSTVHDGKWVPIPKSNLKIILSQRHCFWKSTYEPIAFTHLQLLLRFYASDWVHPTNRVQENCKLCACRGWRSIDQHQSRQTSSRQLFLLNNKFQCNELKKNRNLFQTFGWYWCCQECNQQQNNFELHHFFKFFNN